jgi:flagellar hook-basal body complex protein FliE
MDAIKGVPHGSYPLVSHGVKKGEKGDFLETLKGFSRDVNDKIQESNRKTEAFAVGDRYDLHEIMIASEEAGLSLKLLLQIRNKLIEAYQEIMRMQM